MSSILVLWCVISLALASYALEHAELFENFIQKYERNYADESEKQARFEIFKENLEKINRLNEDSDHAVFDITQFFDLSHEEFVSKFTCLRSSRDSRPNEEDGPCKNLFDVDIQYDDAPESFDWRDHGVVAPVKNQGLCGSCFAFSAIGNIEGQYAIKHKELISLSAQQIVDCDKEDAGCFGGLMNQAIRSLINQGGSESEADYPYEGVDTNACRFDANKVKVKIDDCLDYNITSQEKLKQLVYHTGPIAIAVKGSGLQTYSGGIIPDESCDVGRINHGVLLVGYGSENGIPYWIAKNSWGTKFGEKGYFRMHRGEDALSCSMMDDFLTTAVVA